MTLEFFIPGNPPRVTDQEHRIGVRKDGKPYIYRTNEQLEARAQLQKGLAPYRPDEPISGPCQLLVKWCFSKGRHQHGEWKITKPDTDNLNKALKDVMTELGFWVDDALVCSEIVEKFWSDVPGIYVKVTKL